MSQYAAVPTTTAALAYAASGPVPTSEADSCRIYGSSYSGVSFGSGFSPDNLLLTDHRPVRSRSVPYSINLPSLCGHQRIVIATV